MYEPRVAMAPSFRTKVGLAGHPRDPEKDVEDQQVLLNGSKDANNAEARGGKKKRGALETLAFRWGTLSSTKKLLAQLAFLVLCSILIVSSYKSLARKRRRTCKSTRYGWIESSHHAFGISNHHKRSAPRNPYHCNEYVSVKPGFCLCNLTAIASPGDYGHGPIKCEDACVRHRVVGSPLPACPRDPDRRNRKPCDTGPHDLSDGYFLAAKRLHTDFYRARGNEKKIGVNLPGWRSFTEDFVWDGKRLRDRDVDLVVSKIDKYKAARPEKPAGMYKGRGIVMVGGSGTYETPYWIAVHSLRRTGCKLPIEVWFPDKELPSCEKKKELTKLGVTVRAFGDLEENIKQKSFIPYKSKRAFQKYSFMYKMFAMVFSSFEEVLSLDSNIVSVRNPDFLFESKLYKKHGSVFWMDFWNSSSAPDCQRILGQQTLLQHSHESGQMLVNKTRMWDALMLALYMNSFPSLFYPLTVNYMGMGDKETLPMAILHHGMTYGLIKEGPDSVGHASNDKPAVNGNTMMQHCPAGKPLFMHANLGKMTTHFPAHWNNYVRRWQVSVLHGRAIKDLINEYAGTDLEKWLHDLVTKNHCLFGGAKPKYWHERLGIGPLYAGFNLLDHPNLNANLQVCKKLVSLGYQPATTM